MATTFLVVCNYLCPEEFLGANSAAMRHMLFDLFDHEAHTPMVLLVSFPLTHRVAVIMLG